MKSSLIFSQITLGVMAAALTGCVGGSTLTFKNDPPRFSSLQANGQSATPPAAVDVTEGTSVVLTADAYDPNSDPLTYDWNLPASTSASTTPVTSQIVTWSAPTTLGTYQATCSVNDGRGGVVSQSLLLQVVNTVAPLQATLSPPTDIISSGTTLNFTVTVANGNSTPLTYQYFATAGTISPSTASPSQATYTAPATPPGSPVTVYCIVTDSTKQTATASAIITVQAASAMSRY